MNEKTAIIPTLVLLIIISLDGLNLGIILPIAYPILYSPESVFVNLQNKIIFYGLLLGAFPVAALIGSPALGHFSDIFGRKRVLFCSLLVASVINLISGISIAISSLSLLVFSRFFSGLVFGNEAIAQAAIVDKCSKAKKTLYLSYIECAICLGFAIGPIIGVWLSKNYFSHEVNFSIPFYFSSLLCVLNAFFLKKFYTEAARENYENLQSSTKKISGNLIPGKRAFYHKERDNLIVFFKDSLREIRVFLRRADFCKIYVAYLMMQMGWGCFVQFIPYYLYNNQGFSNSEVSYFYLFIAAILVFTLIVLLPKFLKFLSTRQVVILGLFIQCFAAVFSFLHVNNIHLWLGTSFMSIGTAFSFVGYLTLMSNIGGQNEQGKIMGIANAVWSISWMGASLLFFLVSRGNYYKFNFFLLIIATMFFFSLVIMILEKSFEKLVIILLANSDASKPRKRSAKRTTHCKRLK